MNFEFDEQHTLLRKSVREFARAEIAPHAQRWDHEERFPAELVPKLAKMGLLGIRVPEEYGGAGVGMGSPPRFRQEDARGDGSVSVANAAPHGPRAGPPPPHRPH